jgi:hypothetical protein
VLQVDAAALERLEDLIEALVLHRTILHQKYSHNVLA